MSSPATAPTPKSNEGTFQSREKERDVRRSNIVAAKAVSDAIRTILGPHGMDKMIENNNGDVFTTNDGATILAQMDLQHPVAKMLVDVSKAQDIEAGDGTTTVVILCGALLSQVQKLMNLGISPQSISEGFSLALKQVEPILKKSAKPVDLSDRESLIKIASTSLNSKIINQHKNLAEIAVDCVLKALPSPDAQNVDLSNVQVVKKTGKTLDHSEIVDGLILFNRPDEASASRVTGPRNIKNARIGLIQFQLAAPKPDMQGEVVVTRADHIDRIIREEQLYIAKLVKKIKKTKCNVLLIQKSILKDAVNDISLHYLNKAKILVVTNVERKHIDFIAATTKCTPIASIEQFTPDKLGTAALVEEISTTDGNIVKVTGVPEGSNTVSVLLRATNRMVLEEADRSLHDALCVIRSLVKKRYTVVGGGAPEMEVSYQLSKYADTLGGKNSYVVKAFADALEVIPTTLAENAGMNPVQLVTELRSLHSRGLVNSGIDIEGKRASDLTSADVSQPLLVSLSAMTLATEFVQQILKIDDVLVASY